MTYCTAKPQVIRRGRNNITHGGVLNFNSPSYQDILGYRGRVKAKAFCECRRSAILGYESYYVGQLGIGRNIPCGRDDICPCCGDYVFWSTAYEKQTFAPPLTVMERQPQRDIRNPSVDQVVEKADMEDIRKRSEEFFNRMKLLGLM